jgi:hypothetical protein
MIMITRKQIEEILDDTLEGDNPIDSAPTVVGKEECVNRLMELVKNCSISDVMETPHLDEEIDRLESFKNPITEHVEQLKEYKAIKEALSIHSVSKSLQADIRNKLNPISNLIAMLEDDAPKSYMEVEIERAKESVKYLSNFR